MDCAYFTHVENETKQGEYKRSQRFCIFCLFFFLQSIYLWVLCGLLFLITQHEIIAACIACIVSLLSKIYFFQPLDLTTKKVIPEIPFDNAQYFPPSRQREEYHPECPRLQPPQEDAVRGADHGGVVLTGVRPSLEDVGNPRCRYFETTYHKDSVELVNTSMRTASGLDYPSHTGIPKEEDRTQTTQQCVIKSPLYRDPRSAESPQRELLRLQGEATKNGGRHTPTQGEWAPDQQLPPGIDTPGNLSYEQEGLRVSVLDAHLWMAFNEIQTEMIINRGGRSVSNIWTANSFIAVQPARHSYVY